MNQANLLNGSQFQAGIPANRWAQYMAACSNLQRIKRQEEARVWALANKKRSDGKPFTHADAWRFAKEVESPIEVLRPKLVVNQQGEPVANSTGLLPYDAWRKIDTRVVQIARTRLTAMSDIESLGLTVDLGDLGTMIYNWHAVTDLEAAHVSMNAMDLANRDEMEYNLKGVPVPIISKTFQFDIRSIMAAARAGVSLNVSHADAAALKVADMMEDILFNGATGINFAGGTIPGLRNHAQRVQVTGATWGTSSNILLNVNSALADLAAQNFYGPYGLYVSPNQFHEMKQRPVSGASDTAQQLVDAYDEITFVRMAPKLADGEAILIQLTSDVVEIGIAQDLTTVQWDEGNGMAVNLLVMAAKVPILKAPDSGAAAEKAGWAHITSI